TPASGAQGETAGRPPPGGQGRPVALLAVLRRPHAAHAAAVGRRSRPPTRTPARPTNGLATATHAGCFALIIASRFPTSPVRASAGVAAAIRTGIADSSPMTSTTPASTFGGVALRAIQAHRYPPRTAAPTPSAKLITVQSIDGS